MNKIDNEELDRLIEDAVIEIGARKRFQALESQIRRKEQKARTLRRIFWCAGGAVSVAAAVAAVVLSVSPTREQVQKGIELSERYITSDETYRDIEASAISTDIQYAVSEMRNGNTDEALAVLENLLKSIDDIDVQNNGDDSVFIDKKNLEYARKTAEWYIALAYLNQGKLSKAKSMLKSIKKSGNYYADDAAKVLEEILQISL